MWPAMDDRPAVTKRDFIGYLMQVAPYILQHLRDSFPGRTRLVISHRVSTVRGADHIVVLDAGRVVEAGTHEELLRRGGVYAQIFEEQMVENELEAL